MKLIDFLLGSGKYNMDDILDDQSRTRMLAEATVAKNTGIDDDVDSLVKQDNSSQNAAQGKPNPFIDFMTGLGKGIVGVRHEAPTIWGQVGQGLTGTTPSGLSPREQLLQQWLEKQSTSGGGISPEPDENMIPQSQTIKDPLSLKTTTYKPVLTETQKKSELKQKADEITSSKNAEMNAKRAVYRKDLESFMALDDVLQNARGDGTGRFGAGATMAIEGIKQNTDLGRAVATHDAARKRLRVQLVRAAGDVGNINIVEQKAAESMIPTQWDDKGTAKIKRAYLIDIGKAIDSEDGSEVKNAISTFMKTDAYKKSLVKITDPKTGKTYNIPKDAVAEFKKDKGIK